MRFLRALLPLFGLLLGTPLWAQNEAPDLNQLIVTCTSNLRTVYAEPIGEGSVTGGAFIDEAIGGQTLEACQALTTLSPEPTHLLWLAFAHDAAGDQQEALQALGRIAPPGEGVFGLTDPAVRAADMRRAMLNADLRVQVQAYSYLSPLAKAQHPVPRATLNLAHQNLISSDQLLVSLQSGPGQFAVLDVYQGLLEINADGERLGPDLLALRAMSEQIAESEDTLTSVQGLIQAAAFFGRGFDAQGVRADEEQAQKYLQQAFEKGFYAWFNLGQPEAYRDELMAQAAALVADVLEGQADAEFMETLVQAVAMNWAGLQLTQGLTLKDMQARAIDRGSALAAAEQVLQSAAPVGSDAGANVQRMRELAIQDPCVYDIWAQATAFGLIGEVDIEAANLLFREGQNAGKVGAFVGAGNMHRWDALGQGYDFDGARALYEQGVSALYDGICGLGDAAAAYLQLAWMAHTGQGGGQDLSRARDLFHAALAQGSFAAAQALADMYLFGLGVPQDRVIANDLAAKAYLWNREENLQLASQTLHLPLIEQGMDGRDRPIEILSRTQSLTDLWHAASLGNFYGLYYLGLAAMADPEGVAAIGVPLKGTIYLQALGTHVGSFERGYVETGEQRARWFEDMRQQLDGQKNLTFTSARHDTVAAIAHDPRRALTFYEAIEDTNPTAQKLLDMDRFAFLSEAGQAIVGEGPVKLADIVALGLDKELRPLPLHMLMIP